MLSAAYGMRGAEGDLDAAREIGDRALVAWVPGTRPIELAEFYHLHADTYYWTGEYERTFELSRLAAEAGGLLPHSAEFRLRGVGMQGLSLAGVGRYEDALAAGSDAIALSAKLGMPDNVVLNYSTTPLREIFQVDLALERSSLVAGRLGPSDFNMPWMNARADVIGAHLLLGELGLVEDEWPSAWEDALACHAWEHWLIMGRLAAYRADLELQIGRLDEAVTWGRRALENARTGRRPKYEAIALTLLGQALTAQGSDALAELRSAVETADRLGSPLLRWQTRAALAGAPGVDREGLLQEAASLIRGVAASLAPERSAGYLAAPQVIEVLEAVG
jgi:tetratricopeptide (TPR) repeat protein